MIRQGQRQRSASSALIHSVVHLQWLAGLKAGSPGVVVGVLPRTWGKVGRVGVVGRFASDIFVEPQIFLDLFDFPDFFATIRFSICRCRFALGLV